MMPRRHRVHLPSHSDIYHLASSGLWALAAALFLWVAINMPALVKAQETARLERAQDFAAREGRYCEKWGMPAGTPRHAICVRDLAEYRDSILETALERDDLF